MKNTNNNSKVEIEVEVEVEHDREILKAVAQAWHGNSGSRANSTSANEFDACRLNFKRKPTRFKLETMSKQSSSAAAAEGIHWDFGQSLWDSYEIVSVSKRLEAGLVLDHHLSEFDDPSLRRSKRRKESRNSLRNLFNKMSSKSFNEVPETLREEGS